MPDVELPEDHYEKIEALRKVLGLLGHHDYAKRLTNLIASDFDGVDVEEIDWDFAQAWQGVRISFVVSNHALGKVLDSDTDSALALLLGKGDVSVEGRS